MRSLAIMRRAAFAGQPVLARHAARRFAPAPRLLLSRSLSSSGRDDGDDGDGPFKPKPAATATPSDDAEAEDAEVPEVSDAKVELVDVDPDQANCPAPCRLPQTNQLF